MNSVKWPLSPGVLIAQWIERRHSVWEAMALILIRDSNSFFVPPLCYVDPFIFTEFFCTFTYSLNLQFCIVNCFVILERSSQQVHFAFDLKSLMQINLCP